MEAVAFHVRVFHIGRVSIEAGNGGMRTMLLLLLLGRKQRGYRTHPPAAARGCACPACRTMSAERRQARDMGLLLREGGQQPQPASCGNAATAVRRPTRHGTQGAATAAEVIVAHGGRRRR